MASARTTLRAESLSGYGPGDVLRRTNRVLRLDRQTPLSQSAFYALLHRETGRLTFSNAGHPAPLLYKKRTGEIIELDTDGFFLGMFDDGAYGEKTVSDIECGDALLLYRD